MVLVDNIGGGVGYFKADQTNSSVTYNNSSVIANNGTIKTSSNNNTNLIGANITANNININSANNLNIASLQNETHNNGSSFGLNLGVGSGTSSNSNSPNNASFGISSSHNNTDRVWVDNQTSVIGANQVNITTTNNTNINGALIANATTDNNNNNTLIDHGNLNLTTRSLTYQDIRDSNNSYNGGFNLSESLSPNNNNSGNPNQPNINQDKNQFPSGNTVIGMSSEGYEQEQITRATVGGGSINIANNNHTPTLNRNINQSQEITRDTVTGALNIQTNIDNRLLTSAGRNQIVSEISKLPTNLTVTGYAALNNLSNATESIIESMARTYSSKDSSNNPLTIYASKQSAQVVELNRASNRDTRSTLRMLPNGQSPDDIQVALNTGINDLNHDNIANDGNHVYANNDTDSNILGFNDRSNNQGYVNLASGTDGNNNATNTDTLIFTDAHERAHNITSNEDFANMAGREDVQAWHIANWIYGGGGNAGNINTNNNIANPITLAEWNRNYNADNSNLIRTNNQIALQVTNQDRLYNTVLLGGAGYENETVGYMTQWQERFERAGVVKPEYVPISFGGQIINMANAAFNLETSSSVSSLVNNSYLENSDIGKIPVGDILNPVISILRSIPVTRAINASNNEGGQRNFVGYSYGSIIAAHSALDLANRGIYVDNVGLVGSPISSDSYLYRSLVNNPNIGNVSRIDIANDPFSNGVDSIRFIKHPWASQEIHFYYTRNSQNQQNELARQISQEFNKKQ